MTEVTEAVMKTDLPFANKRQGKVRDLYDITLPDGSDGLLIIATDRVSVFDVVLANGIPGKGVMLTKISEFWFNFFEGHYRHHLISTDVSQIPGLTEPQRQMLDGRVMICRKSKVVPVECIVRGYLTGSGYKDYLVSGKVCGINLPAGMVNSDRIEDPIFTLGSNSSDDNKDRGIEFRYHDGTNARIGFFGYDDSAEGFAFLTAASNSSEVFSGTAAKIIAGELDISGRST